MNYYSGKLIIHNESSEYNKIKFKELGHVLTMSFSVNFNRERLYLSSALLKQFLSSPAVQKYIMEACKEYMQDNEASIKNAIQKTLTVENEPRAEISIMGKFFYIKFYCGRNHDTEQLLTALKRKLMNQKTIEEILRGE